MKTPVVWPPTLYKKPFNTVLWLFIRYNALVHGTPIKPFCHITPGLFVGGKINRAGWKQLESWGVSVLINLRVEKDDLQLGIHPQQYLWIPTIDGTPPTLEQLTKAARVTQRAIAEGRKVYIHCAAGVGRAPTTAAAYLMSTGMGRDEAIRYIQQRRPIAEPGQWQRQRLTEFAETILPHL